MPGVAEQRSAEIYPIVFKLLRDSKLTGYEKLFSVPIESEGYPRELWNSGFIGWSSGRIPTMLSSACSCDLPVFIHGESGTGKELVARYVHRGSARKSSAFIPINCAALPGDLLYSELFGHKKGAFTGANSDAPGKFRQAQQGTIFLDEIGDLDARTQLALLRFLEDHKVTPLGGMEEEKPLDVRIICATHRNLQVPKEREARGFRDDLYYRLRVLPLDIPPLRDHHRDLLFLFLYFLHHENNQGRPECRVFPFSLFEGILWYDWPGNVRELRNFASFYVQYCRERRHPRREKPFRRGTLYPFFAHNHALRRFLGTEMFAEVQRRIDNVSEPLMRRFADVNYWSVVGLPQLRSFLQDIKLSKWLPASELSGGRTEFMIRFLLTVVTQNEQYMYEILPQVVSGSPLPIQGPLQKGAVAKYDTFIELCERSYFLEILKSHRYHSDNALAEITGVHRSKIKRMRLKYRLPRNDNPEEP